MADAPEENVETGEAFIPPPRPEQGKTPEEKIPEENAVDEPEVPKPVAKADEKRAKRKADEAKMLAEMSRRGYFDWSKF